MKFGFHSCMSGVNWGGSEELWWHTAMRLADEGHELAVNFKWWPRQADKLEQLQQRGARLFLRERPPKQSWMRPVISAFQKMVPSSGSNASWLERERPDLLHVTLGYHPDRVALARECRQLGIPYVIQLQCASWNLFVPARNLEDFREAYSGAERVFVVSQENLEKLEINLGMRLNNVELVCNPYGLPRTTAPTWPSDERLSLACVGRIHFASKGQDLLVQVLRRPKWRDRNLQVVLYGNDQGNQPHLEELIRQFDLGDKIRFGGFADDLESMWAQHHGLLLCSRYEGAAIVVVEAMMAHRLVISTDTGRNRELVDEDEAGFIAAAPTADLIDAALEKAWQARDRWRDMGLRAGRDIRERFPDDPVGDYLGRIKRIAGLTSERGPAKSLSDSNSLKLAKA